MLRFVPIILFLAMLLIGGGCASKKEALANDQINNWLAGRQTADLPVDYRVQPPDVLLIQAPKMSELKEERVTIRPDGKISLNLLGDVMVAGMTPAEISRKLRQLALKYYEKDAAEVFVTVVEFKSKVVYVFGQVSEPGIKPFTGRDTLLDMLGQARLNENAWPQKIVIVRPNEDPNVKQKVTVDVKTMWQTGDVKDNFMLEEGDVIYVPPSPLAQANTTFTRLLSPLRGTLELLGTAVRFGATGGAGGI
jgi:protein involved in polysaccharide export with SLBB domain